MTTLRCQLNDLRREARLRLESHFGQAAQSLLVSATFCKSVDAPYEIKIQVPCGVVHGFAGSDMDNAVRNLERFGMQVIGRGIKNSPPVRQRHAQSG